MLTLSSSTSQLCHSSLNPEWQPFSLTKSPTLTCCHCALEVDGAACSASTSWAACVVLPVPGVLPVPHRQVSSPRTSESTRRTYPVMRMFGHCRSVMASCSSVNLVREAEALSPFSCQPPPSRFSRASSYSTPTTPRKIRRRLRTTAKEERGAVGPADCGLFPRCPSGRAEKVSMGPAHATHTPV